FEARAAYDSERHDVHLRVAQAGGRIYIDLGDWNVVEVDVRGWRVVEGAPVRFRRAPGMSALPVPERGGSVKQLRKFVNLTGDGFVLYVAGILDAMRPGLPHPVFYLAGEEGSAKSTAVRIARSLTDPSDVPLRTLPSTVRDLFVGASAAYTLMFDNV